MNVQKLKAPNVVWSSVFVLVVYAAEMYWGHETVADAFAKLPVIASMVTWVAATLVKMYQEYQADVTTVEIPADPNSRSINWGPGWLSRVLFY